MPNDEITVDTQDETTEGETESTEEVETAGEETPKETEPKPEGVTLTGAELRHYKKWKASQSPATKPTQPQTASPQQGVEETVLLAQGMPEELVEKLKAVARVEGIQSLLKAQANPIFVAVKEKFEKDQRQKEASLGASRGAQSVKVPKKANTPGLSREEHMRLAKEAM